MKACLTALKPVLAASKPEVIDYELIPDFNGKPEDMVVWFICEHKDEKPALVQRQDALRRALQRCMSEHAFPASAVDTVRVYSTSMEEVEEVGRFYYFR